VIGNLAVGIQDFVIPAPLGDFQSIATVTVGSGGATEIEFTSIASTWQHLQIRGISRSTHSATSSAIYIYFNSDTGTNFSNHGLFGDGASAGSFGTANTSNGGGAYTAGATSTASIFGAVIIDVLDYKDTNKYTTSRLLSGADFNGSGQVRFASGSWRNTAAVTTITIKDANGGNLAQYSHFALYGIKG